MMGAMQKEHKLFKQLLSDTIIRICQTGLNHSGCFTVDALVGVRLDDGRVFIVNIQKSDSAAEPLHSGHSVTQVIADDDGTSLDMHVDEIVDVKQESVTFTTKERAVKNRGERRSKRLEKKHLISWKSGSSKAALKGNIKKSVVHHGNRRARQTNNPSSSSENTRVTDDVVDECMAGHEEKQNAVEKSQDVGVSDCDATVEGDIKEENNRTTDDSTDKAIVQLDSDEFSRYDNDAEPARPGSGTEEGYTTVGDKAEGAKTEGDKAVVKWTCHVCGYSSAYKTNFERHLFLHGLTPNGKTHACDECGKRCRDAHELRTHVSVKHRKQLFRCARCGDDGKAFQSQKALRYHMATKHTGEFRYRCTVCDKTFLYGAHFRTHMNVHDGVRQLCPHCGKQFNYRGSLKKHMDACGARRDDDNRPIPETFRCEHCDRTFRSRSYLTDHVYTRHLGTRRYTCTTCGATFIYRTGLARHRAKCSGTAPEDGVSENSAEARLGGSAGGRELIAGPSEEEEESTFVDDLLAEAGSDTNVALLPVALQGYVSHEVRQLTGRDDAASSFDVSASVTSLSTTVALAVPSSEATLTMPSSEVTLTMPSSEATLTMPSSEATLIMSSSEATLSMPVFSADGLQYATSVSCQPSDRPCLVGACGASLESRTVTQLFNNSANPALQLIDVASSHQDGGMSTVTAAPSNHAIA